MSKKGSALMQVLVIGLIIAGFAVLILRYAITRSSNLARTDRILQSQIIADSCLEQYMAFLATTELSGRPPVIQSIDCKYYDTQDNLSTTTIHADIRWDPITSSTRTITTFTIPVHTGL